MPRDLAGGFQARPTALDAQARYDCTTPGHAADCAVYVQHFAVELAAAGAHPTPDEYVPGGVVRVEVHR